MKKTFITLSVMALTTLSFGQKNEMTSAAVAYKNLSPMWMMQQNEMEKSVATIKAAKEAIDKATAKQKETGALKKPKDIAKLNYYQGMIYLDYGMMGAFNADMLKEVTANEEEFSAKSLGALKKSLAASNYYEEEISQKMNMLRGMSIQGGVAMFEEKKYQEAFSAFAVAVEMSDVIDYKDTLAMFNAALAADNIDDYDNAIKYYHMAAENNYTNSASPYSSLLRVVNKKNGGKPSEETKKYLDEAKAKYPNDIDLIIEEFNYYNSKGDAAAAKKSLDAAIAKDPNNPIFHYSIGTTFDKMANQLADEKKFDEAQVYIEKAKEAYNKTIELNPKFADAYYNMAVLYNNESYNINEQIKSLSDVAAEDAAGARATQLLKDAVPFLVKANELAPTDSHTLKLLKTLYFTLEMEEEYKVANDKLKALGQ